MNIGRRSKVDLLKRRLTSKSACTGKSFSSHRLNFTFFSIDAPPLEIMSSTLL